MTIKMFGYNSTEEYYKDASCLRLIDRIHTPLLCINAIDDPFVDPDAFPTFTNGKFAKGPHASSSVILMSTKYGGHVAWLAEDQSLLFCERSWVDDICVRFVQLVLRHGTNKQ
eukprot:TRINITY_DN2720_c0_g1_i1.p1 TRINITY_DN2720_c0_g1~~TRINITY_DN2720_c0_g1_i1.p1  ORF type:complete len:113 (+),score=13.86 TRINITY_DN2720_c0_g1_i1:829-1167(+)